MGKKKQPGIPVMLKPVGEKLKKYRYDQRLTQSALAENAGVSTVLLANLESNQLENIQLDKLVAIANACGENVSITLNSQS